MRIGVCTDEQVQKRMSKKKSRKLAGNDLHTHEKQARSVGSALQVDDGQVEVQWTYHHCLGGMPWPWWSCSRGRPASTKDRMDTSTCMSTTRLEECTQTEDNPFFLLLTLLVDLCLLAGGPPPGPSSLSTSPLPASKLDVNE